MHNSHVLLRRVALIRGLIRSPSGGDGAKSNSPSRTPAAKATHSESVKCSVHPAAVTCQLVSTSTPACTVRRLSRLIVISPAAPARRATAAAQNAPQVASSSQSTGSPRRATPVTETVRDWLAYGLADRSAATVANYTTIAEVRIIGSLGRRKLRELSAEDVDRWLRAQAREVSTRTLRLMHSILNRAVTRAMARDKVKRNVVALCAVPTGRAGRPSKSLTMVQAKKLLAAARGSSLHAYIVLSLLTGARTEEVRALRWEHVDLTGRPDATPPVPPSISVLRSVRVGGDTKTLKSRRRFAMPAGAPTLPPRTER